MRLVELFTTGPARVLGIERKIAAGAPADLTIFSSRPRLDVTAPPNPPANRATRPSTAALSAARRWRQSSPAASSIVAIRLQPRHSDARERVKGLEHLQRRLDAFVEPADFGVVSGPGSEIPLENAKSGYRVA